MIDAPPILVDYHLSTLNKRPEATADRGMKRI